MSRHRGTWLSEVLLRKTKKTRFWIVSERSDETVGNRRINTPVTPKFHGICSGPSEHQTQSVSYDNHELRIETAGQVCIFLFCYVSRCCCLRQAGRSVSDQGSLAVPAAIQQADATGCTAKTSDKFGRIWLRWNSDAA